MSNIIPVELIERKIYLIRGQKVMIDRDLALLYGVETRDLNKAVTRNLDRFPPDFMFMLNKDEFENLKFHFGTSSWGGTRKLPRAFTEPGVAMLSSVLKSKKAIKVNIAIMRAFINIRQILATHKEVALKLKELEARLNNHDLSIKVVFETIRKMIAIEEKPKNKMGFDV